MNLPKPRQSFAFRIPWFRVAMFGLLGIFLLVGGVALFGPATTTTPPLVACRVEADPNVVGRAYAQFVFERFKNCSSVFPDPQEKSLPYGSSSPLTYETDDYGQTWHIIFAQNGSYTPIAVQEWATWHNSHNVPGLAAAD